MEFRQEENSLSDGQVSIWSVRRKLFISYFIIFSLLFVLISGIAAWLSYTPVSDFKDLAELTMAAMGLASGRILWLAAFSIVTAEVGNVIVEYLIVERYKRAKREGVEEGIRKGEVGERSRWQAWYERMKAAQREDKPFDEPPPGSGGT